VKTMVARMEAINWRPTRARLMSTGNSNQPEDPLREERQ
jgi:hypothetical protein